MSGARFKPLAEGAMTPAQARVTKDIAQGPRKTLRGPFVPLLRSPELADRVQKLGLYFRFETKLPKPLKELAILVTARHWGAQYEWVRPPPIRARSRAFARDLRRHRARRCGLRRCPRTRRWFTTMRASS